ncbi:hypothetical protein McpSp1_11510 [Methanocorpusculaceae archaeon Sp1]|nr:hypothetical protein [Methanocorpusculaceae archaeon Sp1]
MVNIGLNEDDSDLNKALKDKFGFKSELDMYLFAFAYAIKEQLPPVSVPTGTKWNTPDWIDLQRIVNILYPEKKNEPHMCDNLAHTGLHKIKEELSHNPELTIYELMK